MEPRHDEPLLGALRAAADDLMSRRGIPDIDVLLAEIVAAAVETVPGAHAGGVSMTVDGRVTSRSPSNRTVTELDALQSDLHEGPCISAIEDPPRDGLVIAHDLAGDDASRWPAFASHAVRAGYRAMVSVQLSRESDIRAALNLYTTEPGTFDTTARLTAGMFGVHASALIFGAKQAEQLQRAVDSRDVIGQAKGVLMERFGVGGSAAFLMLVTSSQQTNIKLVDVAAWLVGEAEGRARRGDSPQEY